MKWVFTILTLSVSIYFVDGATWYVRPLVYSGNNPTYPAAPIPVAGTYGTQNGTSFDNAWNGITSIVWGSGGVLPGDTVYVCDDHNYVAMDGNYGSWQAVSWITTSGSNGAPITIRMDYAGHPGRLFGLATGVHTSGFRFAFCDNGITTNNNYITFLNCYLDHSVPIKVRTDSETGGPNNITYNGCTLTNTDPTAAQWNSAPVQLWCGFNDWTVTNCLISGAASGVNVSGQDGRVYRLKVLNNRIENIGLPWSGLTNDNEGIGVQAINNSLFNGNTISNTGSGIVFYTETTEMTNNEVRNNKIFDSHVMGATSLGDGIDLMSDVSGNSTNFICTGNLIVRAGTNGTTSSHGYGISSNSPDRPEIYNNTIVDCRGGMRFQTTGDFESGKIYNNMIISPRVLNYMAVGGVGPDWHCDYNFYYPVTGTNTGFNPGIDYGTHNVFGSDPLLKPTYYLSIGSPAINVGTNVGLPYCQSAPDMGAFEFCNQVLLNTLKANNVRISP